LDDVVADVHGVGVGGEEIDLEGSGGPAGGLKRLVPPTCTFEQGSTDRFGCAAINVVLDGCFGFAGCAAGGGFLVEAVAGGELLVEIGAKRCGVVAVACGEVAGTGIEAARDEAGAGEREEGLVLAEGEGFGIGRVDVVDNGVDGAYFGSVEGPRTPDRVLFLGSLDWRPNQDAVRVLR